MRKYYPYLEDQTFERIGYQIDKREFLSSVDNFINMKQYVRITLLTWSEQPLREIQGEITSGTLSKDGSSAVRRTCTMSVSFNAGEYDIDNIKSDYSINKKVFVEIGVKNYTHLYKDYPILWFPQGIFFISTFSIQSSASTVPTAQINLKDKMCGLNGDVGGTLPATVIFDSVDTQTPTGEYVTEKVRIYDIIKEAVNHYGGEPLDNIIIEDVPLRIKRVVRWMGENPLYIQQKNGNSSSSYVWYNATTRKPNSVITETGKIDDGNANEATDTWRTCPEGTDVGYVYDDFVYTGDLTCNLGDSVVTLLDKLKSYMGNYEYFYDVFGMFHFREIKNYLNTTQATTLLKDMDNYDYLVDVTTGKSVYTFSDKNNLVSITNSPKYENIKNDYIIQGKREGDSSSSEVQVRYHLAIDTKPIPGNTYYDILIYRESSTNLVKIAMPHAVQTRDSNATDGNGTSIGLPAVGNLNVIYHILDENSFVYWKDDGYLDVNVIKYYPTETVADATTENTEINQSGGYTTKDWRTELYLQGMLTIDNNTDSSRNYTSMTPADLYDNSIENDKSNTNKKSKFSSWLVDIYRQTRYNKFDPDFYYEELDAFWPQIYDLENQKFYGEEQDSDILLWTVTDGNYYLDFIDAETSGLGEYSVHNIGRRTDAVIDDDVNCLFEPEIPNIIWISTDSDDMASAVNECKDNGQPYSQVRGEIYQYLYTGGYKNGAFERLKSELWLHTTYQKTLSLTSIPVFYLEPNSRVSINDTTTNTYGDYMLNTLSIPLGAGNLMASTCSECIQKM